VLLAQLLYSEVNGEPKNQRKKAVRYVHAQTHTHRPFFNIVMVT